MFFSCSIKFLFNFSFYYLLFPSIKRKATSCDVCNKFNYINYFNHNYLNSLCSITPKLIYFLFVLILTISYLPSQTFQRTVFWNNFFFQKWHIKVHSELIFFPSFFQTEHAKEDRGYILTRQCLHTLTRNLINKLLHKQRYASGSIKSWYMCI